MAVDQKTREALLQYYKNNGLTALLSVGTEMLNVNLHKKVNKALTNTHLSLGAVGATVLEACLLEFIKVNRPKDWHVFESVVLPDLKSENDKFLTEIDMLLVTPSCVYLFEVKTYNGEKALVGEGIIVRDSGKNFNVFQQQKVHSLALNSSLGDFRDKSKSILVSQKAPIFDYSLNPMIDRRTKELRKFMPLLNVDNIFDYLARALKRTEVIWNVKNVVKVVNLLIEKDIDLDLRGKHLDYVRSLHSRKK